MSLSFVYLLECHVLQIWVLTHILMLIVLFPIEGKMSVGCLPSVKGLKVSIFKTHLE